MLKRSLLAIAIAQSLLLPSARALAITVTSPTDGVPADDGTCTLREAIENANTDSQNGRTSPGECEAGKGADLIDFDPAVFGNPQLITLNLGEMLITESLTITGPGEALLTLDADNQSRHFRVDDSDPLVASQVSISDLQLEAGQASNGSGGAIYAREDLTLARMRLTNNAADFGGTDPFLGRGGGLRVDARNQHGVSISLNNVHLEGNQARQGGGLALDLNLTTSPSVVTMDNVLIEGNMTLPNGPSSPGQAGGLIDVASDSSVAIRDSVIRENLAYTASSTRVGGLLVRAGAGSDILLERVQVLDNVAGIGDQGAIGGLSLSVNGFDGDPASIQLIDSTISGNQAIGSSTGGLEFAADGPGNFRIERSTISGNSAGSSRGGGFLDAYGATIEVINSTISGNVAGGNAGGLDVYSYNGYYVPRGVSGRVAITRSTIFGNVADSDLDGTGTGGGIFINNSSNGDLVVDGSIVASNIDNSPAGQSDLAANGMSLSIFGSLLGNNTGTTLSEAPVGSPDSYNNLIGDPAGAGLIDPMLSGLMNNGGLTETQAPGLGSPVIDAAGGCAGSDQRGVARPQGAACDMGSVEVVDDLFKDRFQTSASKAPPPVRLARLDRETLENLLGAGHEPVLALHAVELGGANLQQGWAHVRRADDRLELRLSRVRSDRIELGTWTPVTQARLALLW